MVPTLLWGLLETCAHNLNLSNVVRAGEDVSGSGKYECKRKAMRWDPEEGGCTDWFHVTVAVALSTLEKVMVSERGKRGEVAS